MGRSTEREVLDRLAGRGVRGREPASWSCAARRASARPRCCATPPGRRRRLPRRESSSAWRRRWSCLRRAPSALRADARPARPAPGPQRDALGVAVRLAAGEAPERFLRRAGRAEPAGRGGRGAAAAVLVETRSGWTGLGADPRVRRATAAGGVGRDRRVAAREPARRPRLRRVCRSCRSTGCGDSDARALLREHVHGPARQPVVRPDRRRDAAATRSRCSSCRGRGDAAELAGGFGLLATQSASGQIEENYVERLGELPDATQRLLLAGGGRAARRPGARPAARPRGSASTRPRSTPADAADC